MKAEEIITFENVSFSYADGTPALDNVCLSLRPGEFVAVIGRNGSGKSTLAKLCNAILTPASGRVTVDGKDTAEEENQLTVRRTVGMVFQNPDNQIVASVVEEDVAFALENLGIPSEEIRRRVDETLRAVDMFDYREHAPHRLSGGQKQRVAIAGVVAMQPRAIVLDEPTAMLDPQGRREVMGIVRRLCREQGIAVMLVTHHMNEAARCDRVVVMDGGRVVAQGLPREIFADMDALHRAGLSAPQPVELMEALRAHGFDIPKGALTAEECAESIFNALDTCDAPSDETVYPFASIPAPGTGDDVKTEPPPGAGQRLAAEGLSYSYGTGTPFERLALDDVSMALEAGALLGVIGHTGSGKSTLMQHLNGLLKPNAGRVLLDGRDIWTSPRDARQARFKVGLVFQYPEHQLFEETVGRDIAFGPRNMGLPDSVVAARVREAMDSVGLSPELADKSPFDLSGGQKRRAAIAGVLAMAPEVLVLDEPTAGLDPAGRDEILGHIRSYHESSGSAVILVSHNMEEIARQVSRVVVLRQARVWMAGTPGEIFARASELEAVGLSAPAVTRVMCALHELGLPVDTSAHTVEQAVGQLLSVKNERIHANLTPPPC